MVYLRHLGSTQQPWTLVDFFGVSKTIMGIQKQQAIIKGWIGVET